MGFCLYTTFHVQTTLVAPSQFHYWYILMGMSGKLPDIGGRRHSSSLAARKGTWPVTASVILEAIGLKSVFLVVTANSSFIFILRGLYCSSARVRAEYWNLLNDPWAFTKTIMYFSSLMIWWEKCICIIQIMNPFLEFQILLELDSFLFNTR